MICEQCQRPAGEEMIRCPRRASGDCPYGLRRAPIDADGGLKEMVWGAVLFLAVLSVVAYLWGRLAGSEALGAVGALTWWFVLTPALLFFLAIAAMALLVALRGAYGRYGTRVTLFNPDTGREWRRGSLMEVEVERLVVSEVVPETLDLAPLDRPGIPPSVAALPLDGPAAGLGGLSGQDSAVELLSTTLAWMIAEGRIRVTRARVSRSRLVGKETTADEYLLQAGDDRTPDADGRLERKIVDVVTGWQDRGEAREFPQGVPMDRLVWAVLGEYALFPARQVIHLAARDAEERGFGQIHSRWMPRFHSTPARRDALRDQGRLARGPYRKLQRSRPDLARFMERMIRKGLRSRLQGFVVDYPDAS
jgi:hypothetical protein